jgi:hypothetical protein
MLHRAPSELAATPPTGQVKKRLVADIFGHSGRERIDKAFNHQWLRSATKLAGAFPEETTINILVCVCMTLKLSQPEVSELRQINACSD